MIAAKHCLLACVHLAWALLLTAAAPRGARAETSPLPPAQPKLCLGYNPNDDSWGAMSVHSRTTRECGQTYAYYGVKFPSVGTTGAASVPAAANCCPLPTADILTSEATAVTDHCPEGFVATGGDLDTVCSTCTYALRCTRINESRYQLGPEHQGVAWGAVPGYFWRAEQRMKRSDLPPAIRFGLIRLRKSEMASAGCVGAPAGSLLVGKTAKRCNGYRFRELQYRGLAGDPPRGTPVKMYPDCVDVSDLFDPNADCMKEYVTSE